MAEMKHTPGPWHFEPGGSIVNIVGPKGGVIAETSTKAYFERHDERDIANARLIAAAPDMYEALCRLCNELEMPGERGVLHGVQDALAAARAALARAEGRS